MWNLHHFNLVQAFLSNIISNLSPEFLSTTHVSNCAPVGLSNRRPSFNNILPRLAWHLHPSTNRHRLADMSYPKQLGEIHSMEFPPPKAPIMVNQQVLIFVCLFGNPPQKKMAGLESIQIGGRKKTYPIYFKFITGANHISISLLDTSGGITWLAQR